VHTTSDETAYDHDERSESRDYSTYDDYDDYDDAPYTQRMRRRRSDREPAPRSRGRMTEEARKLLATEREADAAEDRPPIGFRWTTWDAPSAARGPEPYPGWLVTDLAAADIELGVLKTGKEADVHVIERVSWREPETGQDPQPDRRCLLASKRYRSPDHRLFHRDASYLEGRRSRKSRERRAVTNRTNFGRNLIAQQWALAEFAALGVLWTAGVPVPYPVQHLGTEVLMEFVRTDDGSAAPRLAQLRPEPARLRELWEQLVDAMVVLARLGYTHGDLSAYNVLVTETGPVLIDVPQLVDVVRNPQGSRFLERDVRRMCDWFASRGLSAGLADADALTQLLLDEAGLRPATAGPALGQVPTGQDRRRERATRSSGA